MMHSDTLLFSTLFLELIFHSSASMCDALFKVKSVCGSSYGPPLKIYTNNQSKAKCAVVCSQDTSCYSSVYDDITHVCQIFPDYHAVGGCATAEYYSAVFQSTCHVPPVIAGQIFSWCENNNDCYVADSECRNHSSGHAKCQCLPGLSHDPVTKTCVTTCSSYGQEFQEDRGHLLLGLTDGTLSFTDINTCFAACINETTYECRTIEVWLAGSVCYFSKDTANTTSPTAREANSDYDLYQRDCAP